MIVVVTYFLHILLNSLLFRVVLCQISSEVSRTIFGSFFLVVFVNRIAVLVLFILFQLLLGVAMNLFKL